MNTRLQVEIRDRIDPGIDLVEQMIGSATARSLRFAKPSRDRMVGGSRVYAEDPFRNFRPSRDTIERTSHGLPVRER